MIKETRAIMGMPITLMTPHEKAAKKCFSDLFDFFTYVDEHYSPFINSSDVSKINRNELDENYFSDELRNILEAAEQTKQQTNGYFDIWHDGTFDPSGIVKGWAIQEAAAIFRRATNDFYIEAGGDIQVSGVNDDKKPWNVGIRNPFNRDENVAVVALDDRAVATSGTAVRGQHIYDPVGGKDLDKVVSLTVIASNIIDADRMATAAFAMGESGIEFIQGLNGYEGYMIDSDRQATMTTGWHSYKVVV